ncbi:MAG TPA: amidohydrolase family protein [Planctomycetia bacterium]|nr:amidohydrolase family protein [Planctomycetia bacterium]
MKRVLLVCALGATAAFGQPPGASTKDLPIRRLETRGPAPKLALKLAKIITCAGPAIDNGVILVKDGKIEAVGPAAATKIPPDYEVHDLSDKFAMPGLIDCHSHTGGTGDINEMVYQTNPELRILDQIVPHNDQLKVGLAGGVTTITFIPGSGTNMGGWGALMKTGPGKLEEVLVRFPGVLKIAQAGNPERREGAVGSGYMGMNHVIREQLREGRGYVRDWDDYAAGKRKTKPQLNLRLEYFKPLFHREIPVVVHTQGYQVVMATMRILVDEMNLKAVIDHGEFDSFKLTNEFVKRGMPTIIGPRGFWVDPDSGRLLGMVNEYRKRGQTALGVNTDSPVVPQEELFFQATMATRYGWTEEEALRGLTIEPAKALMIDKRVGSLEVGKDADIAIGTGIILDPRHYVTQTLIDGRIIYDVRKERRRF